MKRTYLTFCDSKSFSVFLIVLFLVIITGFSGSAIQANSNIKIGSLSCENQENPIAIEQANPGLSWKLSSVEKGQSQTAYRILVASSLKLLAERKADVWDSKKVRSTASLVVPYGGKKLSSGQKYYWTVMVWDKDGSRKGRRRHFSRTNGQNEQPEVRFR